MDPHAVEQAGIRLERAERALNALRNATDFREAEDAWSDFLLAASGVYAKLEQGAKADGKSSAWFGREKKARRDDQVLNYLHFARNSDEHGVRRVTQHTDDNWWEGRQLHFGERIKTTIRRADKETRQPIGEEIPALIKGPSLALVRAHDDRYGDYCDPPAIKGLIGTDPIEVAEAALPLLRDLLERAAERV